MEHDEQGDRLERQADDLGEQSDRLRQEVADVRGDWEAKKGDGSLPGAQPAEDEQPASPSEEGEAPQVQGGEEPDAAGKTEAAG